MRHALCLLLLLPGLLAAARPATAQVGTTTDVITGTVTDTGGRPVPGAQITAVSVETGTRRQATTNAQGRYTIVFPDGGGRYQITAIFAGMAPAGRQIARMADEDVLVVDLRLDASPITLEGVEVTAARRQPGPIDRTAGAQERVLSGAALERLPVDPNDLSQLATLTPGVVAVGDSLGMSFSVLGQGPAGNQITLDGLSFNGAEGGGGGMGVPQEAVRVTRVITNTYDVSRGQFSGGQIATTTRAGTNQVQGSFSLSLREPSLQWADDASAFSGSVRQNRLSGGVGGPIVRDRLFFFGSFSLQRRSEGVPSLITADELTLQRLGVSPDSVARLLSLAAGRGIYDPGLPVEDSRVGDNFSLLGRLDYVVTDRHTLTLRGDGRWFDQGSFRVGPLALPQTGGTLETSGGGAMATLTSQFGNGWINEFRGYVARNDRGVDPYQPLPEGRVRVSSILEDGARSISTLSFGGGTSPTTSGTTTLEVSDELSLLIGTRHRVRVGGLINSVTSTTETGNNRYGTFTYNSLDDLEANRPASFSRMLSLRERESGGWNAALYAGDTWRPRQALQLTYGVRLESSGVRSAPEANPEIARLFGLRTDRVPSELAVTPRIGFAYTIGAGGQGPPAGTIRGGIGGFRAAAQWGLFAAARDLTGLASAQEQIVCVGAAVPEADWAAFLRDPAAIPSECAGGVSSSRASGRAPTVAVFDPQYRTSTSWRASLGFQRRIASFLGVSADATYALGVRQQGLRDLNLRGAPAFALQQEGDRPVYVPAQAVVPRSGEPGFFASREHPEYGQVLEVSSDRESRTAQLTLGLNGFVPRLRMFFSGSYTHLRSRDQGSGGWLGLRPRGRRRRRPGLPGPDRRRPQRAAVGAQRL